VAYNRYLKRELHRRQYTFTKTKAFIGFILSTIFSIIFGAYFDRYGPIIIKQTKALFASEADARALPPDVLELSRKAASADRIKQQIQQLK